MSVSREMLNVIRAAHLVTATNLRYIEGLRHFVSCPVRGSDDGKCDCGMSDFCEALILLGRACWFERGGVVWHATSSEVQTELDTLEIALKERG